MTSQRFELAIQLRWGDMDSFNHVNNVQVARLFEEARVRALADWFGGPDMRVTVLVARQEIEFASPLAYTLEPATIVAWISRVGTASFDIAATLTDPAGRLCAQVSTTLVSIDSSTGRSAPLTEQAVSVLGDHLGDPLPFRHRS